MSVDGWREDLDGLEFCASCKLALPKSRSPLCRIGSKTFCILCYDMQDAISENEFMKKAQEEYRVGQQNLKKLTPGEDYLK
jgi:hypothetical protein